MHTFTLDPGSAGAVVLAGLAQSDMGLALFDTQGRLAFGNAAFLEMFRPAGRAQSWCDLLSACRGHRQRWTEPQQDPEQAVRRYLTLTLADGTAYLIREITHPGGWHIVLVTDITRIKANEHALQSARDEALLAANTDTLTGLFNRRFMQKKLQAWLTRSAPAHESFCVCLIDLDHFKSINDTYGHLAGDETIQHFARQAQSCLRVVDILGRFGGEEFLLLMPGTQITQACSVMARLKERFTEGFASQSGQKIRYTFSAGITVNQAGDSWCDILQRADAALYRAKRAGRNRWMTMPGAAAKAREPSRRSSSPSCN